MQAISATLSRPQRVLIFWGGGGFGHLHAAKAIEAALLSDSPSTEVILKDIMEFQSRIKRELITRSYDIMTRRLPKLYDWTYRSYMKKAESVSSIGGLSMTQDYRPDRMLAYIKQIAPTRILTTFSPATECIAYLRDKGEILNVAVGQVLTDYVPSKYFSRLGERIEMTFVPHEGIQQDFVQWGLDPSKIGNSGIPVHPTVQILMTPPQRRDFLFRQGLKADLPLIVLVSGAAGVGSIPTWVKSLLCKLKQPTQVVVICGKNRGHFRTLEKLRAKVLAGITLKLLETVPQETMIDYLKAAEVVVSKTGGLTATEIALIGKPAVFLDINGGQERYNSEFFEEHGMGLVTKDQTLVGSLVNHLLDNEDLRRKIISAQASYRATLVSESISLWTLQSSSTAILCDG